MLNRGATLADFQPARKPLAKELSNVIEIWGAIKPAQSRISRLDIPSRPAPLDLFSFLKKRQNLIAISGDELESFTKARGIILKTRVIVDRKVFRLPVWGFSPAKVRFPYNSKWYRSIITILRRSFILSHSPVVFSSLEHQHIADGWARSSNKSECFQDVLCRLIDTIEIIRLPLKIGNWKVLWKLLFCPPLCHFSVLHVLRKMNLRVCPPFPPCLSRKAFSQSLSVNSLGWRIWGQGPKGNASLACIAGRGEEKK